MEVLGPAETWVGRSEKVLKSSAPHKGFSLKEKGFSTKYDDFAHFNPSHSILTLFLDAECAGELGMGCICRVHGAV